MGITTIVMAVDMHEWLLGLMGAYFAAMGIFSFGCAGGNCYTGYSNKFRKESSNSNTSDIQFEEVK